MSNPIYCESYPSIIAIVGDNSSQPRYFSTLLNEKTRWGRNLSIDVTDGNISASVPIDGLVFTTIDDPSIAPYIYHIAIAMDGSTVDVHHVSFCGRPEELYTSPKNWFSTKTKVLPNEGCHCQSIQQAVLQHENDHYPKRATSIAARVGGHCLLPSQGVVFLWNRLELT